MWPGLGLRFILIKVVRPLRIIFDRRLEPELAGSKHGCRQVQISPALVALAVQNRTIIKYSSRATSPKSLPQGGIGPKATTSSSFISIPCDKMLLL